jgi:hypothetical protein
MKVVLANYGDCMSSIEITNATVEALNRVGFQLDMLDCVSRTSPLLIKVIEELGIEGLHVEEFSDDWSWEVRSRSNESRGEVYDWDELKTQCRCCTCGCNETLKFDSSYVFDYLPYEQWRDNVNLRGMSLVLDHPLQEEIEHCNDCHEIRVDCSCGR